MKNTNIEVLRILSAILVIIFHQYTAYSWNQNISLITYMGAFLTVPIYIFMIITGFFKSKSNNYNFFSIFFLILICWIINFIIAPLILWDINGELDYVSVILGGRDWWYIWAFLFIQLLSPIFNLVMKNIKKYYLLLIIIVIIILFWIGNSQGYGQFFKIDNIILFTIMYFIGGFIRYYIKIDKYFYKYIFFLGIIAFYTISTSVNIFTNFNIGLDLSDPSLIIFATLIFLFVISFKSTDIKWLNYFGSATVYMYLFHYLFDNIVNFYIKPYYFDLNINLIIICSSLITILLVTFFSLLIAYPINLSSQKLSQLPIFVKITNSQNIYR